MYFLLQINKRTGLPAINIYTDKDSGKPKGDATLSYEDPPAAKAAVEWFDGVSLIMFAHKLCNETNSLPELTPFLTDTCLGLLECREDWVQPAKLSKPI